MSNEVFWTLWDTGDEKIVYILNTDWVEKGNTKPVKLVHNGKEEKLIIRERCLTAVRLSKNGVTVDEYEI